MKEYKFISAEILPVNNGVYIKWECENIGFGRIEICQGNISREAMSNEFIIALFNFLERQENGKV